MITFMLGNTMDYTYSKYFQWFTLRFKDPLIQKQFDSEQYRGIL